MMGNLGEYSDSEQVEHQEAQQMDITELEAPEERKAQRQRKSSPKKQSSKKHRSTKVAETKHEQKKKKEVKQSVFSLKTLIHYLNVCYGDKFSFKDFTKLEGQDESKLVNKNVVSLSDFSSLDELRMVIASSEIKEFDKNTETEKWNFITHSIWDFKLRGILTAINDNKTYSKDEIGKEKSHELLMKFIVPQLKYDQPYTFDQAEIKDAIVSFLKSERVRFKLFNNLFPHPELASKDGKSSSHLNKLYLQNVSAFHDKYVRALFTKDKVKTKEDLFRIACEEISKSCGLEQVTPEFLMSFDWEHYKDMKFSKEDKEKLLPIIKKANKERNISAKYFNYIKTCLTMDDVDSHSMTQLYKQYKQTSEAFSALAESVQKMKQGTIKDFVTMFVKVFKELDEPLHYKHIFNTFIKDIGFNKKLVFTQKFKQVLSALIKGSTMDITYIGNIFRNAKFDYTVTSKDGTTKTIEKNLEGEVIQEVKYSPKSTYNTLAKIGLFIEEPGKRIRKDIKVAIGVAIMDFIKTECDKMFSKKSMNSSIRKIVYVK